MQGDTLLPKGSGDMMVRKVLKFCRDAAPDGQQRTTHTDGHPTTHMVGCVCLDVEATTWYQQGHNDDQDSASGKDLQKVLEFLRAHQWSWMRVRSLELTCRGRYRCVVVVAHFFGTCCGKHHVGRKPSSSACICKQSVVGSAIGSRPTVTHAQPF